MGIWARTVCCQGLHSYVDSNGHTTEVRESFQNLADLNVGAHRALPRF